MMWVGKGIRKKIKDKTRNIVKIREISDKGER